jgi:hypothetical protein
MKEKMWKKMMFKKEKSLKIKRKKKPKIMFSIFKIKSKMRRSMFKKSNRKMNKRNLGNKLNGNFYSINLT